MGIYGVLFFALSMTFIILSTMIPMFHNAFILSVIIGCVFLVGGVVVSILQRINIKLDKLQSQFD